jgi:hypothetical protein
MRNNRCAACRQPAAWLRWRCREAFSDSTQSYGGARGYPSCMRSGSPSRNPAYHCRHPTARTAPAPKDLHVVWLPEGNGAALYERDEVLAIIPPWSGTKAFTVTPATISVRAPSRGNLVQTMFCSNASNKRNPTGRNGRTKNSGLGSSHRRFRSLRKYSVLIPSTTRSTEANGRRRPWCALCGKIARSSSRSA